MCFLCEANLAEIKKYGNVFGYPDCCIKEFIKDTKLIRSTGKDPRNNIQKKIALKTHGFVPCKMHAKLIQQRKITAEDLVSEKRDAKEASKLNKLSGH